MLGGRKNWLAPAFDSGGEACSAWTTRCVLATILVCASSASRAQLVVPPTVRLAPPWNAQHVFEPVLYPRLWWDTDNLMSKPPEDASVTPPEDLPVRIRQQPGYEPVGIRVGSWMLDPSLTTGAFYDSNVFSSNIMKRGDVALRVHPALFARSLWERHEVQLQADVWSDFYRNNPGLDQTNASIRERGRIDVRHATAMVKSM